MEDNCTEFDYIKLVSLFDKWKERHDKYIVDMKKKYMEKIINKQNKSIKHKLCKIFFKKKDLNMEESQNIFNEGFHASVLNHIEKLHEQALLKLKEDFKNFSYMNLNYSQKSYKIGRRILTLKDLSFMENLLIYLEQYEIDNAIFNAYAGRGSYFKRKVEI